jgi:hypothetical protein
MPKRRRNQLHSTARRYRQAGTSSEIRTISAMVVPFRLDTKASFSALLDTINNDGGRSLPGYAAHCTTRTVGAVLAPPIEAAGGAGGGPGGAAGRRPAAAARHAALVYRTLSI